MLLPRASGIGQIQPRTAGCSQMTLGVCDPNAQTRTDRDEVSSARTAGAARRGSRRVVGARRRIRRSSAGFSRAFRLGPESAMSAVRRARLPVSVSGPADSDGSSSLSSSRPLFELEQGCLCGMSAAVGAELTAGAHDAMARDDDRQWVGRERRPGGPDGLRAPRACGDVPIRRGLSVRDLSRSSENLSPEACSSAASRAARRTASGGARSTRRAGGAPS